MTTPTPIRFRGARLLQPVHSAETGRFLGLFNGADEGAVYVVRVSDDAVVEYCPSEVYTLDEHAMRRAQGG